MSKHGDKEEKHVIKIEREDGHITINIHISNHINNTDTTTGLDITSEQTNEANDTITGITLTDSTISPQAAQANQTGLTNTADTSNSQDQTTSTP